MKAYKFLRRGRRGPFSGVVWPEAGWVETDGELDACRSGVHACRPEQLGYWLMPELWEVELDYEMLETPLKIVAARGRLVRSIDAWDDETRRDFGEECVRRTARYTVLELREVGLFAEADELTGASTPVGLAETAAKVVEAARVSVGDAADLAAFVGDALGYAQAGHVAGAAFIAAHAAALHSPVGVDDPFTAERSEQSRWLAERLGL